MVAMANLNIPERAIRQQIASAIHAVVQIARLSDGSRKVLTISEITGMDGDMIIDAGHLRLRSHRHRRNRTRSRRLPCNRPSARISPSAWPPLAAACSPTLFESRMEV